MRCVLVALFCASSVAAQEPKPVGGSIAGHVFNLLSGAPIRKATVELTCSQTSPAIRLIADSDAGGAFEFTGLPPGTYRVSARRAGFLSRRLRRVVSLGPEEHVTDAEIRLPPEGVISGRVLDEESEPEPGARVMVFKRVFQNGRGSWEGINAFTANDLGEYRVPDLMPGRYLVLAMVTRPQPNNHYGSSDARTAATVYPVYYQRAATQREASPVEVGLGSEVRGIDIQLFKRVRPPEAHVSGKVVGAPPNSTVSVSLISADDAPWGGGSTLARAPDFGFSIAAPSGPYRVVANVYESSLPPAYGFQSLALAGDVAGISIAMSPAPIVAARVSLAEGAGPVKLQGVKIVGQLLGPDLHSGVWTERSDEAGRLAFPNPAHAGHYTLRIDPLSIPGGYFVERVTLGDQEIQPSDFEVLASARLEIVLASGAGKIRGSVVDKDDKLYPVSTVTLIPLDPKSPADKVVADDAGNFNFTALRPGKYRVFAWEEVDDDLWQDPDYYKKYADRATEVTVGAGETQNARVRVIAAEEMRY